MATSLFGVETEYAIAGMSGRKPLPREELVSHFVRVARKQVAHLPDTCSSSGIFLANGGRFYVDCGLHPEMATPECTTPFELARYIKAGERILEGVAQAVETEAGEDAEIMCFRCNVDYSGSGSTWGCHESYLHHANPSRLPDELISHLVTRVVYTGAGGFNPLSSGIEFCVAPRLMHIRQEISGDSTGNRGIFHTKNEPLAGDGNSRLHILCGESLCSETAIVLKIGATALVTAMAEEGLRPGVGIRLAAPLDALRTVASDVTCARKLRLAAGCELNAIEIQRRLLQLAERNVAVLPPWAPEICALWRVTLDQIEAGPDSVATILDWAIKQRIYEGRIARCGVARERFAFLNSIVEQLNATLAGAGVDDRRIRLAPLLGPKSPIPKEIEVIGGLLERQGLAFDDLKRFLSLRDELWQIDTRFGQIGPRGIFTELDRRGVLDHKVAAVDDVDMAMRRPPAVGRARLRGEAIQRLSGLKGAKCNWSAVYGADGRVLDLSDPFAASEVWIDPNAPPDADQLPLEMQLDETGDPGRFRQMIEAIRGRRARTQARDQSPF